MCPFPLALFLSPQLKTNGTHGIGYEINSTAAISCRKFRRKHDCLLLKYQKHREGECKCTALFCPERINIVVFVLSWVDKHCAVYFTAVPNSWVNFSYKIKGWTPNSTCIIINNNNYHQLLRNQGHWLPFTWYRYLTLFGYCNTPFVHTGGLLKMHENDSQCTKHSDYVSSLRVLEFYFGMLSSLISSNSVVF